MIFCISVYSYKKKGFYFWKFGSNWIPKLLIANLQITKCGAHKHYHLPCRSSSGCRHLTALFSQVALSLKWYFLPSYSVHVYRFIVISKTILREMAEITFVSPCYFVDWIYAAVIPSLSVISFSVVSEMYVVSL